MTTNLLPFRPRMPYDSRRLTHEQARAQEERAARNARLRQWHRDQANRAHIQRRLIGYGLLLLAALLAGLALASLFTTTGVPHA
jgi:hypothetical protein